VKRARTAFDRIAPAAADLMLTITPEQIRHLEQRYAKFNAEFRDNYLQPEPRQRAAANLRRALDRAETLYGRFDDAQRARLAEALARSPFDAELWFAERRERQLEMLQMLRQAGAATAGPEQPLAALRGYAGRLERSPREPYRRYGERLKDFNCALAASLHNATTAAQRRHAAQKLAGWESDLRALAATADEDN
ncbi:MAG TPA: DUF6279 family lipoprotein, partial [Burkholderiaceae bacterium]|nr:DUF6279 family lipoprotein [Burkholderiaceae bacterium]